MFKLSVSGPNSNFPVSSNDVSTYAPIQGSTYPMAGLTSLRPNPQTRSTFLDTDATGVRRNMNIGQEQSPMKTPDMPQLPKEGSFKLGYSQALEKLAISPEMVQRALLSRGIKEGLGDVLSPQSNPGVLDRVHEVLKKFPRTIRRAGPEARRLIYGRQPQFKMQAPISSRMAWKPDMNIFRKFAERAKNITPATGSMTTPGKQSGGSSSIEEKPITRGSWDHAIWR